MVDHDGAIVPSVARMYYLDGLGQSEIAAIVGVSRSTVSRLLTQARERGIVRISVDEVDTRDREAEAVLVERFGLRRAVVVRELGSDDAVTVRKTVGYFAAPVVSEVIRNRSHVGLAGGRTLCELVHSIEAGQGSRPATFVQLMGSIGSSPDRIDGSELCRALARRFQGTFQTLNSPSFAQDQRARDSFLSHREIQSVRSMFSHLDLALVGVGTLEESAFHQRNVLSADEFNEARAAGAVGEICGRFFDAHGRECETSLRGRSVSVELEELRACADVVVVTSGAGRAKALRAAISGGLVTSLVCDQVAAKSLIATADDIGVQGIRSSPGRRARIASNKREVRMTSVTRRRLVGTAAAVAGGAALAGGLGAVSKVAAQEKTEVIFYHIWGTPPGGTPAEKPSPMTQVIEAFNAQSTTTVIKDQTPGSYQETLQKTQADIAAGNPPDLVSTPWSYLNFAVEGLAVNDLATVAGDKLADLQALISDTAWPLVTKDEVIYGLPWGLSTPIFYYNADVFTQAGVDPAVMFDTWESFAAEAPKLQEALGGGPVFALSYNKDWAAQTIIQGNGGRILNEDGTFGVASPEALVAMQTIADLDKAGFYDKGTTEELRPNFVAGTTAIIQGSVASLNGYNNDVAFKLGTSTWPKFGEKPVHSSTGGSFLGVFSRDEAKYAAITEFLAFCAGDVGYPLWNQMGYVNISNTELDRLPGQEPAYAQFDAGLELETNWPSARGLEAQSTWGTYCERIWANDLPVEEGLNQALEEITSITGG